MQYIASLSYGKDSIYMLEVIKQYGMPLDRIVHVEVMATPTIPADLPEMVEFKDYADKGIYKRYGIKVERLRNKESYEEHFYRCFKRGKNKGRIYGFPMVLGSWCNSDLKMPLLKKLHKNNTTYIGIACDEPNRFHNLTETKRSPLVEHNITEQQCYNWCKENNLLSPIYKNSFRGGCWFCHNQSKDQLRLLRKNYPQYWDLMMKWDNDSPVTFKPNGMTIHDFEKLFELEDRQTSLF
jgi:3'-phosphoadenosine 5'-phosphosulfate sulfotransferase (PAPS reductase)/FAD synthetase